jgi:hypothetical protein
MRKHVSTIHQTHKDGSTVEYFQLAHNERHPQTRKPVAKIIHNRQGRPAQELVRLCNSIARVCGLIVTDPVDPVTQSIGFGEGLQKTLALGCPLVVEALWERLGLRKTLQDIEKTAGVHYDPQVGRFVRI